MTPEQENIILKAKIAEQEKEIEKLKGIKPGFYVNDNLSDNDLPRYGIRWHSKEEPIATPMSDGYWTPFHIANHIIEQYQAACENLI
mgnify:CR=1 FL=1|tara:strand:- start:1210 stop:1470 length:261 start_codon:yes stop_codon:yes gene_type:complete